MMKNKIKLIIGIVILLVVLIIGTVSGIFIINSGKNKDDNDIPSENDKKFIFVEDVLIGTNEYYNIPLKYVDISLDDTIAYSLDYNFNIPCKSGKWLTKIGSLSGFTTAVLIYGYPNVTVEELGVDNEKEAIMATQFAIWRLAQADGVDDAKDTDYIFDISNIKAADGYEKFIERVKAAAQKIINKAIEEPYYANPTLEINSQDSKITLFDDEKMIVGPFEIKANGYDVSNIKVSFNKFN